jgi:hypothetical protein
MIIIPKSPSSHHHASPLGNRPGELREHFLQAAPTSLENLERVVAAVDDVEPSARAQTLDDGLEKLEISQAIAGSLKKEHRQIDCIEVLGAIVRGLTRRVERESEEGETADAR